jgi:hypothetical protein
MQLRVVDPFGLPPTRVRMLLFLANSYPLLLAAMLSESIEWLCALAGYPRITDEYPSVKVFPLFLIVWIALNGFWIFFSRSRQSLLDRWLGLNVVLDTRSEVR